MRNTLDGRLIVVSKLQSGYFEIRPFESNGRLYEMLGVRVFQFFVPMGDGINRLVRRFQPDYRIVSKQSIVAFKQRTITAETFHLACLLAIVPSAVYSVVLRWWTFALLLTVPNIFLHGLRDGFRSDHLASHFDNETDGSTWPRTESAIQQESDRRTDRRQPSAGCVSSSKFARDIENSKFSF